jgi:hypothetical protein
MIRERRPRIDDRFHIDHGVNDDPPPRRPPTGPRPLAPGYLWNGTHQQLIPILPEDHPHYRENRELIRQTIRRWDRGER